MSTGAVIQLALVGKQDMYLTGNPQITHFKSVLRRHTHFAIETVENLFEGTPKPGIKLQCKLKRYGDLIGQIYLLVHLKKIRNNSNWVNHLGHVLIRSVEIQIGDRIIDKQYGQWMGIWSELITPLSKKDGYNDMVGKQEFYSPSYDEKKLYIPLQFWFCKSLGAALPVVALQSQDIFINIEINSKQLLYNGAKPCVKFERFSLLVDNIFLDEDERRYFARNKHFYLIEQVQYSFRSIDISEELNIIDLPFNHPVKELIWVIQGKEVYKKNQHFNFSTESDELDQDSPMPPMREAQIRFEGHERFEFRDEKFFRVVLPWKHHTRVPDLYIYTYPFCDKPEELQPSGTCNFSKLDRATLNLKLFKENQEVFVHIYAINYNILRIMGGISGILFSS